jgi:Fe-S-cluster containining protein
MPQKDEIFLTFKEALAAIRADFSQYAPQKHLFLELCRVILGEGAAIHKEGGEEGVWVVEPVSGRMRFVHLEDLGGYLCDVLEKATPSASLFAAVCQRVFRTTVRPGRDEDRNNPGVWIETGMEGFSCRQCGRCCRVLEFHNQCTLQDYGRWEALGRRDIMEWVSLVRREGRIISCQIWVEPGTRQYVAGCPWLRHIPEKNRYECLIHEVRPEICRQYPGSRKHARITGCPGFFR